MIKAYEVLISKKVDQDVERLPIQVLKKFRTWIKFVKLYGIREVRLIKGYHDEVEIIKVIEVHKHDY